MTTTSTNTRHSQAHGDMFVTPPPEPDGTVEIVCSSSRRQMDHSSSHRCYRLFSNTLSIDPKPLPSWPEHTDVHCWNCCHTFSTVPVSIPRSSENIRTSYYEVYGVFCSLNCAKKYILDRNTHDQQQLLMQLNEVCVNIFGIKATDVLNAKEAPPRNFLTMFGGHLSIDEYRAMSITTRTVLVTPPFVSHAMILEEHSGVVDPPSSNGEVCVEPLREGQHELRGLRRPTRPLPDVQVDEVDTLASRFGAFVDKKTGSPVRSNKRKKISKVMDVEPGAGLSSFLKDS